MKEDTSGPSPKGKSSTTAEVFGKNKAAIMLELVMPTSILAATTFDRRVSSPPTLRSNVSTLASSSNLADADFLTIPATSSRFLRRDGMSGTSRRTSALLWKERKISFF